MRSYNVEALKASYTRGTRQWLYNDIDNWISSSTSTAATSSASASSPSPSLSLPSHGMMYMLLAGPGMGKSIFSASVDAKLSARADQGIVLVGR